MRSAANSEISQDVKSKGDCGIPGDAMWSIKRPVVLVVLVQAELSVIDLRVRDASEELGPTPRLPMPRRLRAVLGREGSYQVEPNPR